MNAAKIQDIERLARGVYAKCRDCEGEYRNFANEVRDLQNGLQDVEDALKLNATSPSLDEQLSQLISECDAALQDLSSLVDKFNDLPLQSQRTWDRLNWGQDDDSSLKARLSTLSRQLVSFYKCLRESPTAQIGRALEVLAREVSNGRHETSTATSLSTTAVYPEDDSGWDQIVRDLADIGVPENVVSENRDYIMNWILRAINDGVLTDEKVPPPPAIQHLMPQLPPPKPPKTPIQQHSTPVHNYFMPYNSPPPDYSQKQVAVEPVQRHLSISPPTLRPAVSRDVLNYVPAINMDEPPSPIEQEPAESNILWNAQRICYHWNRREWQQSRENLEAQIACVQRGEIVDISGFPQQPDERILKHLLGVCYSLSGDFLQARTTFEGVLQASNLNQLALDDGDIAAARWLGETCIMTNQVLNASLAWAIAYYGTIVKHPPHIPGNKEHQYILDDLRILNRRTNGLNILSNAFSKTNRDASTILKNMAGTTKFTIITTTLEAFKMYPEMHFEPRRFDQNINIAEGFLIQPLVSQKSWPFPQDPFFRAKTAIELLFTLSRPRAALNTGSIPSTSLGQSKTLVYVTKNSIDWLVEAIRYALNTYAVEWKIRFGEYLLRLSQTHERIAYYDTFIIKFRKLPFRSTYGFKIVDSANAFTTRAFTTRWQGEASTHVQHMDEITRKAKIREELAERLKEYIQQAEVSFAKGDWPPQEVEDPNARGPSEIDSNTVEPNEMGDRRGNAWEMSGQGVVRRKPVYEPMSYEMVAELPG